MRHSSLSEHDNSPVYVTIPDHIYFQEIEGEVVILDLESTVYYGLNKLGSRIWALIQEHSSLDEILRSLTEECNVDRTVVRKDLTDFIQKLTDAELISISNGHEQKAL